MDIAKLKEYVYRSLASLFWSVFLLLGGAIFVSYYAYIGYMPDFDFKSAITLLSAASITSILTIIVFMVILILPGAFWAETWANQSALKGNWEDDNNEKRIRKTALWFGTPILFYYVGFVLAFFYWKATVVYAVAGIVSFYILGKKKFDLHGKQLHIEIWKMLGTSFVCSLLAFFPLYLVATLSFSEIDISKGSPIWIGFIVAIFIAFINVLATVKPKSVNGFVYYAGLGFAAFFVVFASFEIFHRIPERVMEIYKFGAIDDASIVFKSEACETLGLHGLIDKTEKKSQCLLSNTKILSRLGNDMYIEKGDLRITIRNSEVLSWSTQANSNKSIQPNGEASAD